MSRQRLRAIALALIVAIGLYIAPSQVARLQRDKDFIGVQTRLEKAN